MTVMLGPPKLGEWAQTIMQAMQDQPSPADKMQQRLLENVVAIRAALRTITGEKLKTNNIGLQSTVPELLDVLYVISDYLERIAEPLSVNKLRDDNAPMTPMKKKFDNSCVMHRRYDRAI